MKLKNILKILGPGIITGAADDDPSGIATYSQAGAMFGYKTLWLAFFSMPLMAAIQEMCARIGLVTGTGLAGVIKKHYSKKLLLIAVMTLTTTNVINIGADLGAMASSLRLIIPIPFAVLIVAFMLGSVLLQIFVPYKTYSKYLKILIFSLLAYVVTALIVKQDWLQVIKNTLLPTILLNKNYVMAIVAFLGTTISPYLFFWQASEEIEEEISSKRIRGFNLPPHKLQTVDLKAMRRDTIIGMIFSNLMTFFIILTAAATLGRVGLTNIATASQAAEALRPLGGNLTFLLFVFGIVGTGLLAIPILAGSASYAISETFGWKEGLSKTLRQAPGFYLVIALATIFGIIVNFTPIAPFTLLYYSAVVNGLTAPLLMVIILSIANNKAVMGARTNSKFSNFLGISATLIMTAAAVALLLFSLK
ncbi:MAG: Nramp family divalent metal transporter [candidate division WWE3 bacterium]|nr:Nramp family divalent metal transporter [candidate division WWE3 bacterium]